MKLDTLSLEKFISDNNIEKSVAEKMRSFYSSRNYQFAWFTEEGLAEQAHVFWDLHNQYKLFAGQLFF